MSLKDDITQLIHEGERLRPMGGSMMKGYNSHGQPEFLSWRLQVISTLEDLGNDSNILLKEIDRDKYNSLFFETSVSNLLGVLNAALAIANKRAKVSETKVVAKSKTSVIENSAFIVHGHNDAILQSVARFIESIDVKPIILFEQAGKGQTIIEKLESNSSVSFSIVLLTPDDLGKLASSTEEPKPRARQNVIFELGFFIGVLGRSHVCALYDENVELPSDYRGVEYVKIDAEGAWKLKLAKEMKEAGLQIDMNKAI